jgi:hypothetical protein
MGDTLPHDMKNFATACFFNATATNDAGECGYALADSPLTE